ncbi:TniQ family protein [Isoptericola cucumis]|uniref:TniQ domain-containing protein n=1 Tax=Isoptericola cucumis TaxID=1776856 RepID=A0ABQ2B8M5_9MICO|nr:TniQ family protein [Isoptericola cucumis]GGI10292.1 hypothetical protein GCM10007368_30510 [Isoptericola cucumis]
MLPVRTAPQPGQCIQDWLEHLAALNAMSSGQLTSLITQDAGPLRFLSIKPTGRVVARVAELAGVSGAVVRSATVERFDGTGLVELRDLDPEHWSTWRRVAARGWIRATGSAACPQCLADDGFWQLQWRLPSTTVCTRHGCYLVEQCPACGRRLLDHPHTALRPAPGTRCLNPLPGYGHCDADLSALHPQRAHDACITRQTRHDIALCGAAPAVLGSPCTPSSYLLDVWALTVLLLALASTPGGAGLAGWREDLLTESARRKTTPTERGPAGSHPIGQHGPVRWSVHPPTSPTTRSRALATAEAIITNEHLDEAAAALHPWIMAAPTTTDSRLGWLADRTRMTPTLTRLCMTALAPHQRISHALRASPLVVDIDRIPQAVPEPVYQRHAAHLFRTRGETPRHFLALCLVRHHDPTLTWAAAADILGVPPQHGTNTARAISTRNPLAARDLDRALRCIVSDLHEDRCHLEDLVHEKAQHPDWFLPWSSAQRPGTRKSSLPYAVTWLWCHVAGGLLSTSPGWPDPPDRPARTAYRQFEAALSPQAATSLASITNT